MSFFDKIPNSMTVDTCRIKKQTGKTTFSEDFLLGFRLGFQCSGFHPDAHGLRQLTHRLSYYCFRLVSGLKQHIIFCTTECDTVTRCSSLAMFFPSNST